MYHHSLRRPAQSRNRAQAGIHVRRRRPDVLFDSLVGLGGQSLAAVDAADLGLLTVCFLSQSGTSKHLLRQFSVLPFFIAQHFHD